MKQNGSKYDRAYHGRDPMRFDLHKPKYNEAGKMLPHQQTTNINLNPDYAPTPITASNFLNSMNNR